MDSTGFSTDEIAAFWEQHPCGSDFVNVPDWKDFFIEYDRFKFTKEPHILDELGAIQFNGKRVLEIGLGQGAEAQRIIEAGAVYNGIDLTPESIRRVQLRCELFSLPYESLQVMNAEEMEFPDNSFDIVFSHGVIHHSPRIERILSEIYRVLRPGGIVTLMVYHRNSVNYQVSIRIIRRLGIFLLFIPGAIQVVSKLTNENPKRLGQHRENLQRWGISYLRMKNFIHAATDGPNNVFSSVFSEDELRRIFPKFHHVKFSKHFLNERHLPVVRSLIPASLKKSLAEKYGWNLWVKASK